MQKLLNLGCGKRFHPYWTNIDFVSTGDGVIAHNLLKGIPFPDNEFDAVYHSHVLEHFSREDGKTFMKECWRVLKKGGVVRVAIPDLEGIIRNYVWCLEGALKGDQEAVLNYEWIMLELYDQTVRNQSGGEMAKYFFQDEIRNERFVFSRVGAEGKQIRENYLNAKKHDKKGYVYVPDPLLKRIFNLQLYRNKIQKLFFKKEHNELLENKHYTEIGKFRLGGEIHQWMYDRYSLKKLLIESGFSTVKIRTASESDILNWNNYELESKNGAIYKPDSLFVEAKKE